MRWERRHPDEAVEEDQSRPRPPTRRRSSSPSTARPRREAPPATPSDAGDRPGQRGHRRARPDDDRAERAATVGPPARRAARRPGSATRPCSLRPAPVRCRADDPPGGRRSGRPGRRAVDVRLLRRAPGRGGARAGRGAVHDRARPRGRPARAAGQARRRPRRAALRRARRASLARSLPRRWPTTTEIEVAPGIHATFVDAGHILGSAIIRLRVVDRDGGPERRLVFSGDLGRTGTPILRDPTVVTDADYVLVESTYGGREHEPEDGVGPHPGRDGPARRRARWRPPRPVVRDRADPGGRLGARPADLAPGRSRQLPLYLDSPMASKASDIYRAHPDYYDERDARPPRPARVAARLPEPDRHERRPPVAGDRQRAKRPYMIVASNGMLTGGRVVGHLRNLIDDPSAVLLFVGYQGEGTLGAHLQAGAKTVRIDGQVSARSAARSARSAASRPTPTSRELLAWLANFAQRQATRRSGLPAPGVPRPRRPGRPGGPAAQGPRARLRCRHPGRGTRRSSSNRSCLKSRVGRPAAPLGRDFAPTPRLLRAAARWTDPPDALVDGPAGSAWRVFAPRRCARGPPRLRRARSSGAIGTGVAFAAVHSLRVGAQGGPVTAGSAWSHART